MPTMDERYRKALDAAMADIATDSAVVGVLFTGSVQQGRPQATSDLDLYVVTHQEHYWRATRVYEGVEAELFINNVASMRWRITCPEEIHAAAGFATGEILLDRTGEVAQLQALARQRWEAGPPALTSEQIDLLRYSLNDLTEDLCDVEQDPAASRLQGATVVAKAMEAYCKLNRFWGDKPKRLVAYLAERDAALGALLQEYYGDGMRPQSAYALVDYVLAPNGGRLLLWESEKVAYPNK